MFLIDDTGIIQAARKLEGVTCFARVRTLHGFEGKHIGQLTENDLPSGHKNLRKAILDASLNYNYDSGMLKTDRLNQFDVNVKNSTVSSRINLNGKHRI